MTKLPGRNVLDGSKLPKTTTGEMKNAFGELRDYLFELFGDNSADKEAARLSLGIDLNELNGQLSGKAERTELERLQEEVEKRGVPIGSIDYFAMATPPAGYLKADGSAVERETYPELFTAIGTTFGEGDGTTTFNLPDLMGKFAEGSDTPGAVKGAGLPNINDTLNLGSGVPGEAMGIVRTKTNGALQSAETQGAAKYVPAPGGELKQVHTGFRLNLAAGNPIYGASATVQPPALTLLPCIKAFDAASDPGLIDVAQLAQEMTGKLDKTVNGTTVKYVTNTYEDGKHWYRKWSDGWLEQGGNWTGSGSTSYVLTFPVPFQSDFFWIGAVDRGGALATPAFSHTSAGISVTLLVNSTEGRGFYWYACGCGA